MEIEIAKYLNHCAEGRLSNDSKLRLTSMLGVISEIESIADCCYGLGKIMTRKAQSNVEFNENILANIDMMFGYVSEAMTMMNGLIANIQNPEERKSSPATTRNVKSTICATSCVARTSPMSTAAYISIKKAYTTWTSSERSKRPATISSMSSMPSRSNTVTATATPKFERSGTECSENSDAA